MEWTSVSGAASNLHNLVAPIDLHVGRVAKETGTDQQAMLWTGQTAVELTDRLKQLDPKDPVKYDFALFGLGVTEKF